MDEELMISRASGQSVDHLGPNPEFLEFHGSEPYDGHSGLVGNHEIDLFGGDSRQSQRLGRGVGHCAGGGVSDPHHVQRKHESPRKRPASTAGSGNEYVFTHVNKSKKTRSTGRFSAAEKNQREMDGMFLACLGR